MEFRAGFLPGKFWARNSVVVPRNRVVLDERFLELRDIIRDPDQLEAFEIYGMEKGVAGSFRLPGEYNYALIDGKGYHLEKTTNDGFYANGNDGHGNPHEEEFWGYYAEYDDGMNDWLTDQIDITGTLSKTSDWELIEANMIQTIPLLDGGNSVDVINGKSRVDLSSGHLHFLPAPKVLFGEITSGRSFHHGSLNQFEEYIKNSLKVVPLPQDKFRLPVFLNFVNISPGFYKFAYELYAFINDHENLQVYDPRKDGDFKYATFKSKYGLDAVYVVSSKKYSSYLLAQSENKNLFLKSFNYKEGKFRFVDETGNSATVYTQNISQVLEKYINKSFSGVSDEKIKEKLYIKFLDLLDQHFPGLLFFYHPPAIVERKFLDPQYQKKFREGVIMYDLEIEKKKYTPVVLTKCNPPIKDGLATKDILNEYTIHRIFSKNFVIPAGTNRNYIGFLEKVECKTLDHQQEYTINGDRKLPFVWFREINPDKLNKGIKELNTNGYLKFRNAEFKNKVTRGVTMLVDLEHFKFTKNQLSFEQLAPDYSFKNPSGIGVLPDYKEKKGKLAHFKVRPYIENSQFARLEAAELAYQLSGSQAFNGNQPDDATFYGMEQFTIMRYCMIVPLVLGWAKGTIKAMKYYYGYEAAYSFRRTRTLNGNTLQYCIQAQFPLTGQIFELLLDNVIKPYYDYSFLEVRFICDDDLKRKNGWDKYERYHFDLHRTCGSTSTNSSSQFQYRDDFNIGNLKSEHKNYGNMVILAVKASYSIYNFEYCAFRIGGDFFTRNGNGQDNGGHCVNFNQYMGDILYVKCYEHRGYFFECFIKNACRWGAPIDYDENCSRYFHYNGSYNVKTGSDFFPIAFYSHDGTGDRNKGSLIHVIGGCSEKITIETAVDDIVFGDTSYGKCSESRWNKAYTPFDQNNYRLNMYDEGYYMTESKCKSYIKEYKLFLTERYPRVNAPQRIEDLHYSTIFWNKLTGTEQTYDNILWGPNLLSIPNPLLAFLNPHRAESAFKNGSYSDSNTDLYTVVYRFEQQMRKELNLMSQFISTVPLRLDSDKLPFIVYAKVNAAGKYEFELLFKNNEHIAAPKTLEIFYDTEEKTEAYEPGIEKNRFVCRRMNSKGEVNIYGHKFPLKGRPNRNDENFLQEVEIKITPLKDDKQTQTSYGYFVEIKTPQDLVRTRIEVPKEQVAIHMNNSYEREEIMRKIAYHASERQLEQAQHDADLGKMNIEAEENRKMLRYKQQRQAAGWMGDIFDGLVNIGLGAWGGAKTAGAMTKHPKAAMVGGIAGAMGGVIKMGSNLWDRFIGGQELTSEERMKIASIQHGLESMSIKSQILQQRHYDADMADRAALHNLSCNMVYPANSDAMMYKAEHETLGIGQYNLTEYYSSGVQLEHIFKYCNEYGVDIFIPDYRCKGAMHMSGNHLKFSKITQCAHSNETIRRMIEERALTGICMVDQDDFHADEIEDTRSEEATA